MEIKAIDLAHVQGFGKLLQAYLSGKNPSLPSPVFNSEVVQHLIDERKEFAHREILFDRMAWQNGLLNLSEKTKHNIDALRFENTFCITTGHQLALVGGPLFVTYKILTTVKLCSELAQTFPECQFVPVFWLASEDHDKEEIDHFSLFGKNFKWETEQAGAVGNFNTNGLVELVEKLSSEFNGLDQTLVEKLKKAYEQPNLSAATRHFINDVFGEYGVVIVDGNDPELKKLFLPIVEKEVREKTTHASVKKTNATLVKAGFEPSIDPRELNLFLLTENDRKRLEFTSTGIQTVDGSQAWNTNDFMAFVNENPQKISPNVLLRPVYQETILPNLAYVGGPAETEYWLQLDDLFAAFGLQTPQRILRICATVTLQKNVEKLGDFGLDATDVFLPEDQLTKKATLKLGGQNLDFTNEKSRFDELFAQLANKAKAVDPTLEGAVNAEKARQEKAFEGILGRITKAEKTKQETAINRILKIRSSFLPNGKPQERTLTLLESQLNLQLLFEAILSEAEMNKMNLIVS